MAFCLDSFDHKISCIYQQKCILLFDLLLSALSVQLSDSQQSSGLIPEAQQLSSQQSCLGAVELFIPGQ